jgi:hypothetical protein
MWLCGAFLYQFLKTRPFAKITSYLMPNCEMTPKQNFNKGLKFLTFAPLNFHKISKKKEAAVIYGYVSSITWHIADC